MLKTRRKTKTKKRAGETEPSTAGKPVGRPPKKFWQLIERFETVIPTSRQAGGLYRSGRIHAVDIMSGTHGKRADKVWNNPPPAIRGKLKPGIAQLDGRGKMVKPGKTGAYTCVAFIIFADAKTRIVYNRAYFISNKKLVSKRK